MRTINRQDVVGGAIFVVVGLTYGVSTVLTLPIGRALQMGPGYFPVILSALLVILGLATMIKGVGAEPVVSIRTVPWRAIIMLTGSIAVFALALRQMGLLPTVFICSVIACLSSGQIKVRTALINGAGVAAFCTVVFRYGVGLPIPTVGPLFTW